MLPWFYPGFDEVQIERMMKRNIRSDVAARYARAMMEGGCTTAEALELIRDRDCEPVGTVMELWDVEDIPADRWFRDAWRRSPNGGPITVNLKLAMPIQFGYARAAVECENKRREASFDNWRPPIEVDWHAMRRRILQVTSVEELRTIWPRGVAIVSQTASHIRGKDLSEVGQGNHDGSAAVAYAGAGA